MKDDREEEDDTPLSHDDMVEMRGIAMGLRMAACEITKLIVGDQATLKHIKKLERRLRKVAGKCEAV